MIEPPEPSLQEDSMSYGLETLGRYTIEDVLFEQSWGSLYRAIATEEDDTSPVPVGQRVLLKAFGMPLQGFGRFQRGMRWLDPVLKSLSHPALPQVLEVAYQQPGTLQSPESSREGDFLVSPEALAMAVSTFVVMEDVPGESAFERIRLEGPDGRWPPQVAAKLILTLCEVLEVLDGYCDPNTKRSIRHPMVLPEPKALYWHNGQARLLDFVHLGPTTYVEQRRRSVFGAHVFPFAPYFAPEYLRGYSSSNPDVFVSGLMLTHLATGVDPTKPATESPSSLERLEKLVNWTPTSAREKNPAIPEALDDIILRATANAPEDRYPDLRAFAQALRTFLDASAPTIETMQLDEALRWLRDRVYAEDLASVARLFSLRKTFRTVPSLADYAWSHLRERCLAPLHNTSETPQALPLTHQTLLRCLPNAQDDLIAILNDETLPAHNRITATQLLHNQRATNALTRALNSSSHLLAQEAQSALETMPEPPVIGLKRAVQLVSCSQSWDSLQPGSKDNQRTCEACQAPVVRIQDIHELQRFAGKGCTFFDLQDQEGQPLILRKEEHFWSADPGERFTIGQDAPEPFRHRSLHKDHASILVLFDGQIQLRAKQGAVFMDGTRIQETIFNPRHNNILEIGDMVLRTHNNQIFIHSGDIAHRMESGGFLGYPSPMNFIDEWDDENKHQAALSAEAHDTNPPPEPTQTPEDEDQNENNGSVWRRIRHFWTRQ